MNPLRAASVARRASSPDRPNIEGRAEAAVMVAAAAVVARVRCTPISTRLTPGSSPRGVVAAPRAAAAAALGPGTSC